MGEETTDYRFTRYLSAKKTVDDRALNRHVWQSLLDALPKSSPERLLHILEIGAGIGTMVERAWEWGLLRGAVNYTALDASAENLAEARRRLPRWAAANGITVAAEQVRHTALEDESRCVSVEWEAADLYEFMARHRGQRDWDLIIAHAFLDLVDIPSTLPLLFELLRPSGLFYFTLNFDGVTALEPAIDPSFDALIESLYHQTMDERLVSGRRSGDSRSGRHLFWHLVAAGAQIIDAGSSDWVVFPGQAGYPADEAFFLHFIIHTLDTALAGHPALDAGELAGWIRQRHTQVDRAELVYIAHQIDIMGRLVK